jgi:hypothetical protein
MSCFGFSALGFDYSLISAVFFLFLVRSLVFLTLNFETEREAPQNTMSPIHFDRSTTDRFVVLEVTLQAT